MLDFKHLTLQDIPLLAPWFAQNRDRLCDGTVGGEFLWRDFYHIHYTICQGALCLMGHYPEGGFTAFSYPIGGDESAALGLMASYAKRRGMPLIICPASVNDTEILLERFPHAVVEPCRQWYDYLYAAGDLRELAGRKYGGQRNHINRFCKENPNWRFEKIDGGNIAKVQIFFEEYERTSGKAFAAAAEENDKIREVLANWELYGFVGGVLFVGDAPAAFAFAEIVGDTLYVHTEKASRAWHGTYPMIVQQMARAYTNDTVCWINREDDAGDEGLRTVKLSYHPAQLIEKNKVTISL